MKTKFYLLIVFSCFLIFPSCRKYEDGPMFSLQSKKARVIGKWRVVSYTENNKSMFYRTFEGIHSVECCCPDIYVKETFIKSNYTWEFLKGGNVIESYNYNNNILNTSGGPSIYCDEFYTNQIGTHTTTGTWDFGADKESLILRFDRGGFALKILELSNHNIHLNGLVKDAYVNGDVVEAITDIKLQQ